MEIIWHGNTCFEIKDKKATVIINPDKESGKLSGEVVLSSFHAGQAPVENAVNVFDWPGEYEVKGIPIIGFQAWTKSKTKEEQEGSGDKTIIFYFEIDGIKVCHLGELGHVLTSDMVNKIGDVDILIINGGTGTNLTTSKAVEVVEAIDPRIVIPIGAQQDLIKEIGAEKTEALDKFVIKDRSELVQDKRICVVLNKVS